MGRKSGRHFWRVKDGVIAGLLVICGTLIAAKLDGLNQQSFHGRFAAVDGDTVVQQGERFRLLGIDAPELRQLCLRGAAEWPCGQQAREYLARLLQSGAVECRGSSKDKYRRLLVRCLVDNRDIGGLMVEAGFAITTDYLLYSVEQEEAQQRKAGIWGGEFLAPAEWRRERKAADMDTPIAGLLELIRYLMGW